MARESKKKSLAGLLSSYEDRKRDRKTTKVLLHPNLLCTVLVASYLQGIQAIINEITILHRVTSSTTTVVAAAISSVGESTHHQNHLLQLLRTEPLIFKKILGITRFQRSISTKGYKLQRLPFRVEVLSEGDQGPINLPRRLNSGFYFAHADAVTIAAMEKVVKHASTSTLSEQPSFYDTLCGEGGVNRLGDDRCLEPETNLTVHFLDRVRFPNGAYGGLWEKANVKAACKEKGCIILHNNWISGRKRKLERQVSSGLWEFDVSTRICLQRWLGTKSKDLF